MARADKDLNVLRLAADVKRTYMEERRMFYIRTRGNDSNYAPRGASVEQWDGGTDARGANHGSMWLAIVKFAVQHDVDPIALVRATFEMCRSSDAPFPSEVKSQRALEALRFIEDFSVEDMKSRFAEYASEARRKFLLWRKSRQVPDERVWEEVISSPELSFTALFRYVLAKSMHMTRAAEFWQDDATREYIRAPNLYNEAIGDAIPADFREESARIKKLLNRGS